MTADELMHALLEFASRHPWPAVAFWLVTVSALVVLVRRQP